MTTVMFEIPSRDDVESVVITADCIKNRTSPKLILKHSAPTLLTDETKAALTDGTDASAS